MKQSAFTAQELFCMAYLMRKPKMFGIPNVMGKEPEKTLQSVIDNLITQQIAAMDMDGRVSLCEEYRALVDAISDCKKCLTINVQRENRNTQNMIFWLYNGQGMMAEVIGERYIFSAADEVMVRALVDGVLDSNACNKQVADTVIPHIQMVKAKRHCQNGELEAAIRLLRQNGADDEIACVLVDGLLEKANYLGALLMDMRSGECVKTKKAYLSSGGVLLTLNETVINLRSCIAFSGITTDDMRCEMKALVDSFLERGEAV